MVIIFTHENEDKLLGLCLRTTLHSSARGARQCGVLSLHWYVSFLFATILFLMFPVEDYLSSAFNLDKISSHLATAIHYLSPSIRYTLGDLLHVFSQHLLTWFCVWLQSMAFKQGD